MKKIILTVFIVGGLLMWAYVWGGPGISSIGGGGSGSGDMLWSGTSEAKLANVPDLDGGTSSYVLTSTGVGTAPIFTNVTAAAVETDAIALAALTAQTDAISSGGTAFIKSGVTPTFINQVGSVSAVSAFLLSSVTAARVNGAPDFQTGESSYVLTSIGQNKVPIWTNAPAGTGAETDSIALAALTAQTNVITSGATSFLQSAVTPVFINQVGSVSGVSLFLLSSVTAPYVNSLTSSAQAQLDGKQTLDAQLTDLADGTLAGDFVNTAYPWLMEEILSGETVANRIRILPSMTGKAGFFLQAKTDVSDAQWTDTITISGLTIPLATTTAGVTDSVATIRFDPTASQLISGVSDANVSGVTEAVVGGVTEFISFTITGVTNVDSPDDDHYLLELPYNITIKQVSAIQRRNAGSTAAGVPTTINIQECTSALSCTDMITTDWILSGSTTAWVKKGVGDFSDSVGTRGNSLKLDVVSGASNSDLTVTIHYWINRE